MEVDGTAYQMQDLATLYPLEQSKLNSQILGIEEDYWGRWYCLLDAELGNPVPSGTK